jgi:hypothetical protein
LRDNGRAARWKSNWSPWYWVLFLVDCLNYQGLRHAQGDTPDRRQPQTA